MPAEAQARFDAWSIEDGLPQNSVNDILQTRDGYLWLATHGGLVRFDGVRFVVFDRSVEGVGSLRIRRLHEDRQGVLWAATDDGRLIRHANGRFRTFDESDGLVGDVAMRIEEDDAGTLWISWVRRVTRFDGQTFTTLGPEDFPRRVAVQRPHEIGFGQTTLWWNRDADGVHCLHSGRIETCLQPDDVPEEGIVGMLQDDAGSFWIRLEGGDLLRVDGTANSRVSRFSGLANTSWASADRNGNLWFVTADGLYRFVNRAFERVADFGALTMYEDREGSVWFGTVDGLRRLRHPVVRPLTTADGLSSNNVYAMLLDDDGSTWIGTWGGGLNRYTDGRVRTYRTSDGLPSDLITALLRDSTGRLWVGTSRGLVYLDRDRFVAVPGKDGWLTGNVWDIHEDQIGELWFTTDAGLVRRTGQDAVRYTADDGLASSGTTLLFQDSSGALWVGTKRGISVLRDGRFESLTERDGFVASEVRSIHEDPDGLLWVGTYDSGLYRLDAGRLTRYSRDDGLHDNGVFQILPDDQDHFWIGSNRGLYRVSRDELDAFAAGQVASVRSVAFGHLDGLVSLEGNGGRYPAGLRIPDGTLWLPTQGGVAIVDPGAVTVTREPPPVRIEGVRLRGESVDIDNGIVARPDQNSFEVSYTAMSFIKPELVRFRYRLVGLDDDWVEAGSRRAATFYRIPPGEYEFQVIAANSDGVWNTAGDSVAIVIMAPVWRRGWFLSIVALVVAAFVVTVDLRRTRRLRLEHARQRAFSRQLLETQESERRRISNELHDSLGQSLALIRRHARLECPDPASSDRFRLAALDQIAGLAASAHAELREIAYGLRPYQLDKAGLRRTVEGMLSRAADASGIDFRAELEQVDDVLDPDVRTSLYRIAQEAVNNVVRHSQASTATVRLHRMPDGVVLEVEDDGVGFRVGDDALEREGPGHFGLTGMRERALAVGGRFAVASTPGRGARMTVRVPCRRDGS